MIDGEFDKNGFAPTQTEMNRIVDIPGFTHDDQKRAFEPPKTNGGEGTPAGAESSSASKIQDIFGLDGNRRGTTVMSSQLSGSAFCPQHLKKTISHMSQLYRGTDSHTKIF